MKVGIIGAGSMGSLLTGSFIRSGALSPEEVTVATRTLSKAMALADRYPGLSVASGNAAAAAGAELVFLCVKPLDYRSVLDEIRPVLRPEQIVVSITSPVLLADLEAVVCAKVAKIIPSVVNEVGFGATLFMLGSRLNENDRERLLRLFTFISRPLDIPESDVRVASDLSSCGPAFMACLLEQFIDAAVDLTGIDRSLATELACEMLVGTSRMLQDGRCSPAQLQQRVSVPGGITAAALEELRKSTEGAFRRVLLTTHAKFAEDLNKVEASLRAR